MAIHSNHVSAQFTEWWEITHLKWQYLISSHRSLLFLTASTDVLNVIEVKLHGPLERTLSTQLLSAGGGSYSWAFGTKVEKERSASKSIELRNLSAVPSPPPYCPRPLDKHDCSKWWCVGAKTCCLKKIIESTETCSVHLTQNKTKQFYVRPCWRISIGVLNALWIDSLLTNRLMSISYKKCYDRHSSRPQQTHDQLAITLYFDRGDVVMSLTECEKGTAEAWKR